MKFISIFTFKKVEKLHFQKIIADFFCRNSQGYFFHTYHMNSAYLLEICFFFKEGFSYRNKKVRTKQTLDWHNTSISCHGNPETHAVLQMLPKVFILYIFQHLSIVHASKSAIDIISLFLKEYIKIVCQLVVECFDIRG